MSCVVYGSLKMRHTDCRCKAKRTEAIIVNVLIRTNEEIALLRSP